MEITRIFDFIYHQQQTCPQREAFGACVNGKWIFYSTDEIVGLSRQLSTGLLKLGLKKGDRVGMISYKNIPEWMILDLALMQIGVIGVPVYPTISSREYEYIFGEAEINYCFVGEGDLFDKVNKVRQHIPSLKEIYSFTEQPGIKNWKSLLAEEDTVLLSSISEKILPDETATIIYTSGTTGDPKGVMLSHENICSNILTIVAMIPIEAGMSTLSFLPMCHVFEKVVAYAYMYAGTKVYFTGTDNLGGETGDLAMVKPHFFTAVPRLLEKVYDKIYARGLGLNLALKVLFFWALKLTDDYEFDKKFRGIAAIKRNIADRLIYKKWRAALGGNVRGIIVGSAPCPAKIIRTFSAAGIPVREGYGLTESSPGIAINGFDPGTALIGTVGPVIPGDSVFIDEKPGEYRSGEGELVMTGPNVMQGYYKKPAATAEMIKFIDGKRWLYTGDIAMFVEGPKGIPFIKITDRKKELLKTSNGKYVAPSPIEVKLKENFLIEQAMVVGDNRKFVSALIVPYVDSLKSWCENKQINWTGIEEAISKTEVIERFQRIIDGINTELSHTEQIKKFCLLTSPWEATKVDGSLPELTPTLKIKRRVILGKFAKDIEKMYAG